MLSKMELRSSVRTLRTFPRTTKFRSILKGRPITYIPNIISPQVTQNKQQQRTYTSTHTQPINHHYHTRPVHPIKRVLVANRGEISIRVQRACKELSIQTISVYSKEEESSLHRTMADESYLLQRGPSDTPVQAYLNQQAILELCVKHNIDAVHPGYGFLSENGDFAELIEKHNICFIGPSPHTIGIMGDKVIARKTAEKAGIPIIPGSSIPITDSQIAYELCKEIGYPVMLKAAHGGGGRGMRRVYSEDTLIESFDRASSEAYNAFGNGEMFIEKLITGGKHIEVQILGDLYGNCVHLFERDCSIQRRHQKVIEIAPSPFLDETMRQNILNDALKLMNYVGYQNAGTVEFLVDNDQYYFIEVNARLQVEHTVTEEITGIDIVKAQIQISEGKSLSDLNIVQNELDTLIKPTHTSIQLRGPVAIQCRITTEDSQHNFQPSTGRINLFQPACGPGIRLDGAIGSSGAIITPHFDSLLVKLISRGNDFNEAVTRSLRALTETRIRGVHTNIQFIKNVLSHPLFLKGIANVNFIDDHPNLVYYDTLDITSEHICNFLAHIIVNGPHTELVNKHTPPSRSYAPLPYTHTYHIDTHTKPHYLHTAWGGGSWAGPPDPYNTYNSDHIHHIPEGYKIILDRLGPAQFAQYIRQKPHTLLTDTTLRDAHQSLLATRMRSYDMYKIAPYYAQMFPNLFSLENWGGATFDVAYRFLKECPWKRLETLRQLIPNIPFQMLLRGANGLGYSAQSDNSVYTFCNEAVKYGMDIFRVFDSLNYMDNLKLGIQAVGTAGGVVEATISYTGDVADKSKGDYNLDYYLELARQLNNENIHILCIKDMAGVLTPQSSKLLASSLRKNFPNLPIHFHTHDTSGCGVASMLAAAENGADIVDVCVDSMSGLTSQPSMGALVASLKHTPLDTQIDMKSISQFSNYFEAVRNYYTPFECTQTIKATSSDVYEHQIPGGQYTNLHMQAFSLGMADRWSQIKDAYKLANKLLGNPPKVTPSSKIVGDFAHFIVQNNLDEQQILNSAKNLNFPTSVYEFFEGKIGQPPFGFPEPFRTHILKGKPSYTQRPGRMLPPTDFDKISNILKERYNRPFKMSEVLAYIFYPNVFEEYLDFYKMYGDVSILPTPNFFVGAEPGETITVNMAGREVQIKYIAKTHLLDDGTRDVFFEVMGFPRTINVRDQSAKVKTKQNTKANLKDTKQIAAPMPGTIINYKVNENEQVKTGQPLVILSAMKMETIIVAPCNGLVVSIQLKDGDKVEATDLLMRLE